MDEKKVFNIETAASLLEVSTATVRNWVKSGLLSKIDKNSGYIFDRKDIDELRISKGQSCVLNKRANKIKSKKVFVPREYINRESDLSRLNHIVQFVQENQIPISSTLFLLSVNFLKREKILIQKKDFSCTNKYIQKEILLWRKEIDGYEKYSSFLLDCDLPECRDVLGALYQSLLFEGEKSRQGSYYTPENIVNDMVKEYTKSDSKVFDPCCGTGQFLLAYADIVKNPLNIYGIDIDRIAVKISRLNILVKYKNKEFAPNIFCKNFLFGTGINDLFNYRNEGIKNFDVIATNPPWGVHFSKNETTRLKQIHPEITSNESFSYFLNQNLKLLSKSGIISFILPESVLNVKIHKDIREIILKKTCIKKIIYFNRVFKNVFTPVVRLDLQKNRDKTGQTTIENENRNRKVYQRKWERNSDFIFNIHTDTMDTKIIDKVYKVGHTDLKNKALWALGIVTGDNRRFLVEEKKLGFEPVYKGKDVEKFALGRSSHYIKFRPEKFQQVAPQERYRADEKLIYRFISKNMIFAYDNCQRLTLNSANIVIPEIPNYPMKVIAAIFNSSLYQMMFQKKFSSIKVLRSHIEEMPLPIWKEEVFSKIVFLTNGVIKKQKSFQELDSYIEGQFEFSKNECDHIRRLRK